MSGAAVVLVGTDLGPVADEAVIQAHLCSVERDARLIVCHVVPTPLHAHLELQLNQHVLELRRIADLVERRSARLTRELEPECQVIVQDGVPEDVLVSRAKTEEAGLIVVGGDSDRTFERILGHVAERVVRRAAGPVLIARSVGHSRVVLVATDLSDPSLPAVAAAAAEARWRHASLHVLHCFAEGNRPSAARILAQVARWFSADSALHLVDGEAAGAIASLADELHPELLVVGASRRAAERRLALGRVAERVVHRARHSTLVVRPASGGQDMTAKTIQNAGRRTMNVEPAPS